MPADKQTPEQILDKFTAEMLELQKDCNKMTLQFEEDRKRIREFGDRQLRLLDSRKHATDMLLLGGLIGLSIGTAIGLSCKCGESGGKDRFI